MGRRKREKEQERKRERKTEEEEEEKQKIEHSATGILKIIFTITRRKHIFSNQNKPLSKLLHMAYITSGLKFKYPMFFFLNYSYLYNIIEKIILVNIKKKKYVLENILELSLPYHLLTHKSKHTH